MKKYLKNSLIYIILLFIYIYKGYFIKLISYVNFNEINKDEEINLLNSKIISLQEEYNDLTELKEYSKYNYDITRLSYKVAYDSNTFYIYGGKNKKFKIGYALVNQSGLVGTIKEVKDNYSLCEFIDNISIKINDSYGTLKYINNEYIVELSNYDNIHLNDEVYTSSLGIIHEKILVGYVYKIEKNDISNTVHVKSKVDFNNINYLYVIGGE